LNRVDKSNYSVEDWLIVYIPYRIPFYLFGILTGQFRNYWAVDYFD